MHCPICKSKNVKPGPGDSWSCRSCFHTWEPTARITNDPLRCPKCWMRTGYWRERTRDYRCHPCGAVWTHPEGDKMPVNAPRPYACPRCRRDSSYVRLRTKERVCKVCGHVWMPGAEAVATLPEWF